MMFFKLVLFSALTIFSIFLNFSNGLPANNSQNQSTPNQDPMPNLQYAKERLGLFGERKTHQIATIHHKTLGFLDSIVGKTESSKIRKEKANQYESQTNEVRQKSKNLSYQQNLAKTLELEAQEARAGIHKHAEARKARAKANMVASSTRTPTTITTHHSPIHH